MNMTIKLKCEKNEFWLDYSALQSVITLCDLDLSSFAI